MNKATFPNERGEIFPGDELGPLVLKETGYGVEILQKFKICPSDSEPVRAWCVTACDAELPSDWIKNITAIKAFCLQKSLTDGDVTSDRATEAMEFITSFMYASGWEIAEKFKSGRKKGTVSAPRKLIRKLLEKTPSLKNPELWKLVCDNPPKGWSAVPEPRMGGEPYLEGGLNQTMGKSRFFNICGEERKRITG